MISNAALKCLQYPLAFTSIHLQNSQEEKGNSKNQELRDFPVGPVVKTPCFQCRGRRFDPWWGT